MTQDHILQSKREYWRKQRMMCLTHYSVMEFPICEICKESYLEFLAIDHKHGNGKAHRREIGGCSKIFSWLIKNNFPDGYRILCHNCNLKHRDNSKCHSKNTHFKILSQTPNAIARRKYTAKNREKMRIDARSKRNDYKRQAIERYGGSCECCGALDIDVLSIDHLKCNGAEHRREIGNGSVIYRWLKKNNYPAGFRVLCMNCNCSRGLYGYCPHQNIR